MKKKVEKETSFFKLVSFSLSLVVLILIAVLIFVVFNNNDNNNNNLNMNQNNSNNDMNKGNVAVFQTSMGEFEVELFLDKSPITAGNFKELVEKGFYDNTKFHRVIDNFMIQGGDPYSKNDSLKNKWGTGSSGEVIKDEFIKGLSNLRGTIAMANSGPNSGSSQFFINLVDNTYLDWDKQPSTSKHPVFGKVISGMDVVDKIGKVSTNPRTGNIPYENVVVNKIYIK